MYEVVDFEPDGDIDTVSSETEIMVEYEDRKAPARRDFPLNVSSKTSHSKTVIEVAIDE